MTNKELTKENVLLKEVIDAFIEYMTITGDEEYANILRYYYTQSQWDKIIEFLVGDR